MKAAISARRSRGEAALRGRPSASELLLFAPLAVAAVYVLVLAANLPDVVRWLYLDGDAASAMVIAELKDDAPPDRTVFLSRYPWYETLWFMEATRGLPAHRQIWEAAPFAATLFAFAIVAWSALRTIGPWAGATVLAVLVALGQLARLAFFTPNWHGHTAVHVAIVGVAVVWAVQRAERLSRWALVGIAVGLGLLSAPGVASDPLMLVGGIAPLVLAAVALPLLVRGRSYVLLAVSLAGAALIAVLGGVGIAELMDRERVEPSYFDVRLVPGEELLLNVEILLRSWSNLGGGDFFGEELGPYSASELFRAGLVFLGLGAALVALRRWVRSRQLGAIAGAQEPALTTYTLFWGFALVLPVAALLLSTAPENEASARYLVTAYVAAAALVPLIGRAGGWRRWAVIVGATAFAALGAAQLIAEPAPNDFSRYVEAGDVAALEEYARSQGVTRGYGDFWSAANVTWASELDLEVFPLRQCHGRFRYCRANAHVITSWYRPERRRSFLLVDSEHNREVDGPDPAYGEPVDVRTFGQLTAYVYPYDLASRLTR